MLSQPLFPHQLLAPMALPGFPGVYVLGCFARHVTIYSQQVRALNLVDALCRTDEMTAETEVVVVGGGAAGVTAAAAAAVRGARVSIVERDARFFPIQRNAATRYLHPHIYDWPLEEDAGGHADLPLLGWDAADAPVVFRKLGERWASLWSGHLKDARPEELMRTEFLGVERNPAQCGWIVRLEHAEQGPISRRADLVVLALGFGRELESATAMKYWDASPLDSVPGAKLTWLVSGAGDGGLTDLMRLCISDFRHHEYVERFARDAETAAQLKELLADGARPSETMEAAFERVYGQITDSPGQIRKDEIRKDLGGVTLNAPRDYLEDPRSSVLNRFVVFQLQKLGAFTLQPGKLKLPVPPPGADGSTTVRFDPGENGPVVERSFDRVVLRHGSAAALQGACFPALPEFAQAVEELRREWEAHSEYSNVTRIAAWDPADYDPAAALPRAAGGAAARADLRVFSLASTSRPSYGPLSELVELAALSGSRELRLALGKPASAPVPVLHYDGTDVDTALASPWAYDRTVALLCQADVAVIDVTDFEPGVMLFLGIRAAARRGVTVVTTNRELGALAWAKLPFNLRELFPLALTTGNDPERVLAEALASALRRSRSVSDYLDVPAYEAVRRQEAATWNQPGRVLWLCSFSKSYQPCYSYLRIGFKAASGSAQGERVPSRLERITDAGTSQLVTQRLYAAIRSTDLCLVDWSLWSPNVFFELGVRLAVSGMSPVCVLEAGLTGPVTDADPRADERCRRQKVQRDALIRLFRPIEYGAEGATAKRRLWSRIFARFEEMQAHKEARGGVRPSFGAFAYDHTYRLVGRNIPLEGEPGALATDQALSAAADALLGVSSTSDPSLPVLFTDANETLNQQVRDAGRELLAAAWLYLHHRFTLAERVANGTQPRYAALSYRLLELLDRGGDPSLRREVDAATRNLDPATEPRSEP